MAMSFVAASSQYVSLGTLLNSLQNVSTATLSVWVNPVDVGATERFILAYSVGTVNNQSRARLAEDITANNTWMITGRRVDGDAQSAVNSISTISTGTNVHIVGAYNYTGGALTIYINGAQSNTLAIAGWTGNTSNTTSQAASIATRPDAGAGTFFNGIIDDARVYNRLLSANEINTIYRARGKDSIIRGLIHRYNFFEAATGTIATGAGTVRDKGSGTHVNGTPTNSPTYASAIVSKRRRRR